MLTLLSYAEVEKLTDEIRSLQNINSSLSEQDMGTIDVSWEEINTKLFSFFSHSFHRFKILATFPLLVIFEPFTKSPACKLSCVFWQDT